MIGIPPVAMPNNLHDVASNLRFAQHTINAWCAVLNSVALRKLGVGQSADEQLLEQVVRLLRAGRLTNDMTDARRTPAPPPVAHHFVLGHPPNTAAPASAAAQMDALEREAAAHGDLLVGDFAGHVLQQHTEGGGGHCFVHSGRFARHHCAPLGNPVPYALLLDDDYLLFPWNLVAELQR
uniref:Glycosyltransferase family 2 protein n=1 Tax=Globodera pallida TaxID=36090 RepID=A0A183CAS9_GLOPA